MTAFYPPDKIPHDSRGRDGLLFLGGPIQGALDWQADATGIIHTKAPGVKIANPRSGMWKGGLSEARKAELYKEQADWEHEYLDWAMRRGCVLFYLAEEAEHIARRAFAQTTRVELALIIGWMTRSAIVPDQTPFSAGKIRGEKPFVVGMDPKFPGTKYFRHLFAKYGITYFETLEETCNAALKLLANRKIR
jgi:hypothetical protein